jgi:hypothetical protein
MAYNNNNGGNGSFDLNNYEKVKSRKVRLRNEHPEAFILPFPMSDLNYAGNYVMMGALIWKDKKAFSKLEPIHLDNIQKLAEKANTQNVGMVMAAIAIQSSADGAGYSLSMAGGKGADKNAWVENAEESAVGRALDNMGYHSGSASQEEILKVQHMQDAQQHRVQLENQINAQYGTLMQQGHNQQYINQVTSQTVRPFQQLNELSPDELENLLNAYLAVGGQGAYQAQYQQPLAPVPMIPGAPRIGA